MGELKGNWNDEDEKIWSWKGISGRRCEVGGRTEGPRQKAEGEDRRPRSEGPRQKAGGEKTAGLGQKA